MAAEQATGLLQEKSEPEVPAEPVPDPLEQKIKEEELEKQLFEYERNATIPDYFHFESDENNFDSGDQE